MKPYQNRDWLYQKYWGEELSCKKIGETCGVVGNTILYWMKKCGVKSRKVTESHSVKDKPYKHKSWLYHEYWVEGLTLAKIAEISGVSQALIRRYMKKFDIKRRTLVEACKGGNQTSFKKGSKIGKSTQFCKGHVPTYKGKKMPEHIRKNIEIANRKFIEQNPTRRREICRKAGKKSYEAKLKRGEPYHSEEARKNIGLKNKVHMKKLWQNPETVKLFFKATKKRPTNPEKIFDEMTPDVIRYTGNRAWWRKLDDGKHHNPDFKITGQNKVVEIFGDYWHRNDDPQELIDLYAQAGLDCLVFWEKEVYKNPEQIKERVNNFIQKPGKFDTCKKTELIDVFLESGVNLVGKVPDEISQINKK